MKAARNSLSLLVCSVLVIGAGAVDGNEGLAWRTKVCGEAAIILGPAHDLWKTANTNCPEIRAVHAIGTNALPWLLSEMENQGPSGAGAERPYLHQIRATAGFRALGEIAAPAVPKLIDLVEKQPDWVPRALAGIGLPGLTALQQCLTNAPHYVPPYLLKTVPSERAAVSALAALFFAIDDGRIPKSNAAYLLPDVRAWAKDTNQEAAYWAEGVLRKLGEEQ